MTLATDVDLEEYIMAKDDLSGADIKVRKFSTNLKDFGGGGGVQGYCTVFIDNLIPRSVRF